jgi:hypothetical protein
MDTLSYSNETGSFDYDDEPKFIKYMMKLVSEWDISKIREEEKIHPNLLPGESVYATRIIIHNGKYKIGCFCFKDFFDFKRDNIDFIKKK